MKRHVLGWVLVVLIGSVAWSGVVVEMEVVGRGSSGEPAVDRLYAQGEMLRMDPHPEGRGGNLSMLFRDRALWMVDHDKKTVQTIDEKGMEQLGAQLSAATKEMEAAMAQIPPEQRAMMEKMMAKRMPAGMGRPLPPRRLEPGGTEKVGEYSCVVYTMFAGEEKVWEACATRQPVAGAEQAMAGFRAMARFAEQLRNAVQQGPLGEMIQTPYFDLDRVEGFPVRVREFRGGRMTSETTLRSVEERELGDELFSVPQGYKVKSLAEELRPPR